MGLLANALGGLSKGDSSSKSDKPDNGGFMQNAVQSGIDRLKSAYSKKRQNADGHTMMPSYKRGGKVKRTGAARLHKGEQVLNTKQAKRYRRGKGKRGRKR